MDNHEIFWKSMTDVFNTSSSISDFIATMMAKPEAVAVIETSDEGFTPWIKTSDDLIEQLESSWDQKELQAYES